MSRRSYLAQINFPLTSEDEAEYTIEKVISTIAEHFAKRSAVDLGEELRMLLTKVYITHTNVLTNEDAIERAKG